MRKGPSPHNTPAPGFIDAHDSFPGGSVVKNPPANAGDACSIPESGRSPGGGNGNPLQYSCRENPVDRGAWWTTVHGGQKESHMSKLQRQV